MSDGSVTDEEAKKMLKAVAPLLKELEEKEASYSAIPTFDTPAQKAPAAPRCLAEGCRNLASAEGVCANIICSQECLWKVLG